MMSKITDDQRSKLQNLSPWPHRLAWCLACEVLLLMGMGELTTTRKAGMSIPDWPTTFGYWFYPFSKWLGDVSTDLFYEQSHRTIAWLVGLTAIVLLISVFRSKPTKSVFLISLLIFTALLVQATLGGFRVLWEERILARFHGATAPLIFSLCTILATLTSEKWRAFSTEPMKTIPSPRALTWLASAGAMMVYLEIVFGTQVRHVVPDTWPGWFPLWIWAKVITALLLLACVTVSFSIVRKKFQEISTIRRGTLVLTSLLFVQLILASATWIVNYGWPKWFTDLFTAIDYTVTDRGWLQLVITTTHAAFGTLILASTVHLAIWSRRLTPKRSDSDHSAKAS